MTKRGIRGTNGCLARPQLFGFIFLIYEAMIRIGDCFNRHNCRYWASSETDPQVTVGKM